MTNGLQVFDYKGAVVRTVEKDSEVWFVAKDVCDILELSDVSMSVRVLDEDEKLIQGLFVSGQKRDVMIINEPGMYKLIFKSRKAEAKEFTRWVTHDKNAEAGINRLIANIGMKYPDPALIILDTVNTSMNGDERIRVKTSVTISRRNWNHLRKRRIKRQPENTEC